MLLLPPANLVRNPIRKPRGATKAIIGQSRINHGILSRHNGTLLSVPLIHLPCQDIAVIGFRTMLHRIAEPTWARLWAGTPTLIVRESCGAYLPQTKAK